MATTYSPAREHVGAAGSAPLSPLNPIDSVSLAELLEQVGTSIDALPLSQLGRVAPQIAAITAHLVDGTHEAGQAAGTFAPARETAAVVSLRTLGRLAARTAGHEVRVAQPRAQRVRDLIDEISA